MGSLNLKEKRGRPDIIHLTLLEALGSPLNLEGLLETYVHTLNDYVVYVNPKTRLPRNYNRFVGLMEQLFQTGKVPIEGEPLLTLKKLTLKQLLKKLKPTYILALTRKGKPQTPTQTAKKLAQQKKPIVFIGGFPHGHFTNQTINLANEKICLDPTGLDTWIVASRILAAYEETIGLPEKRLQKIQKKIKP